MPSLGRHYYHQSSVKSSSQIQAGKCKIFTASLGMESKPLQFHIAPPQGQCESQNMVVKLKPLYAPLPAIPSPMWARVSNDCRVVQYIGINVVYGSAVWQCYGSYKVLELSAVCQFQGLLLMVSKINLINQEKLINLV